MAGSDAVDCAPTELTDCSERKARPGFLGHVTGFFGAAIWGWVATHLEPGRPTAKAARADRRPPGRRRRARSVAHTFDSTGLSMGSFGRWLKGGVPTTGEQVDGDSERRRRDGSVCRFSAGFGGEGNWVGGFGKVNQDGCEHVPTSLLLNV